MRMGILAFGLACAASLSGQRHFSWQNACFNNPTAPYCQGHDFSIKPGAAKKLAPKGGGTDLGPIAPMEEYVTPSVIVAGGIDWRFADPSADTLVGLNAGGLSGSPLARSVIARLGASQGLSEADMQKIFAGLSSLSRIALSVHDDQIVIMITGRAADSISPALDAGWKAVPVLRNAMLVGHADAVDHAVQRMAIAGPPTELMRLAEEWPADREFWAYGPAGLAGPQAVSAGMKQFSLTLSIRDRLTSNVAIEFNGVPDANTLKMWPVTLGGAAIEGNMVRARTSMEADEVQQTLGEIAASPLGQQLATLVKAARYLPTPPKQTKPVIYGLDSGPKEVK